MEAGFFVLDGTRHEQAVFASKGDNWMRKPIIVIALATLALGACGEEPASPRADAQAIEIATSSGDSAPVNEFGFMEAMN